jgi:hypothetical protein
VRFYAREESTGSETKLGSVVSPPYTVEWQFPRCEEKARPYALRAEAVDGCDNVGESEDVRVVICAGDVSPRSPTVAWSQRLDVPGGSGQVVLDGTALVWASAGTSQASLQPRAGEHQVVATLLGGQGRGRWRFDFPPGVVEAGSLQTVAGNLSLLTADSIAFDLEGKPGERLVFRFRSAVR